MKKSKTEIALIWDAIHGILVRNQNTDMMLESQIEDLNDEVINLIKSDAVKDDQIDDHERRLREQEEIIGRFLTGMSNLATAHRDLSTKLSDIAKTVDSLVADKDALISHNRCRSQRENELQAQVDELQIKINDQAEALEHLSTGMESVAKALTNLDGWMDSVEVVLSALRKST